MVNMAVMGGLDLKVVEAALWFTVQAMQANDLQYRSEAIDKINVELLKVRALRAAQARPEGAPP